MSTSQAPAVPTTARVSFEEALRYLKGGRRVRRAVWGVECWVVMAAGIPVVLPGEELMGRSVVLEQVGLMLTSPLGVGGRKYAAWVPGWADLLAYDWVIAGE